MGTAFWAPRSRPRRPGIFPPHGRKETVVARRAHNHPQTLEVYVTFEPSRLSPAWMAQAYEQVVPIIRRAAPQAPHALQASQAGQTQQRRRHEVLEDNNLQDVTDLAQAT
jgi:hypothetical protein